MTITATRHATAADALQWLDAAGHYRAVTVHGYILSLPRGDFDTLEASGVEFAILGTHAGRIMTIPVND